MRSYDPALDGLSSFEYALRMISLRLGLRRFETVAEMYWQEQHGCIP
jgi:hypothetical protein